MAKSKRPRRTAEPPPADVPALESSADDITVGGNLIDVEASRPDAVMSPPEESSLPVVNVAAVMFEEAPVTSTATSTALVKVSAPAPLALVRTAPRRPTRRAGALDQLVMLLATPLLLCLAAVSIPGAWLRPGDGSRPR